MRFAEFAEFKDDLDKYINIVNKGEDIIITKKGKPLLSLAGLDKSESEDFILAKHYRLEKKAKDAESMPTRFYSYKEIRKYLGL